MSYKAVSRILAAKEPKGIPRLVLIVIAECANHAGVCWPSMATIAERAAITVRHAKRVVHALEKARHIAIIVHGNGEGHSNKYQLLDGDTPVTVSASKTVTRQSPSEIQDGDTAGTQTVTQRVQDGDSPVTLTIIDPSMNHPCSDDASRKSIANDSNHTGGGMDGNKGKENDSWEDAATAARAQLAVFRGTTK